ncbi:MAG TPA: hypothetical protein VIC06_08790 [Solirubrobacteraceae bacterium]
MKCFRLLPAAACVVLALAAAAIVGCGSSGSSSSENGVAAKSPTEILSASKTAAQGASAVHVSGSMVSGGAPITLDLSLVAGKGGKGKISENGLSFELIQLNGTAYISGSSEFYKHFAGPAAAQLLQGKWLKASSTSGSLATLASLTDLQKLISAALAQHGTLTKGSKTTISGQPAIPVTDTTQGGSLYVATTGQPFPIQISKSGSGGGKITFDEWNKPVTITAPANAVDINELQHAGH